jgi:hypothetical protein
MGGCGVFYQLNPRWSSFNEGSSRKKYFQIIHLKPWKHLTTNLTENIFWMALYKNDAVSMGSPRWWLP